MIYDSLPFLWSALQVIWIDLLLSGDNAVVIALACRGLPPEQRKLGILLGSGAAIALRVFFAVLITTFLNFPYIKFIGGVLLLWIAIKLIIDKSKESDIRSKTTLIGAVTTIVIADVVMSLDNVLAVAAAAKGSIVLLVFGLLLSIPLVIGGSSIILKLIQRFPFIVWAGAALLGWIAIDLIANDKDFLALIFSLFP